MSKAMLPSPAGLELASHSGAAAPQDRNFVTALARGLDILRCFDRPGIALSVSEIGRLTGLNQPTAWRLSQTLITCGYLVRSSDSNLLRIGVPALTLGYAAVRGQSFPALARPYMRQISESCGATTTLSQRQGTEMISMEICAGEFVLPNQPVGWRSPLIAIPSGLALLAALPDAARKELMRQIKEQDAGQWPNRLQRIERACAEYRERGFVIMEAMIGGQYSGASVPLVQTQADGSAQWSLSCGGLASRWTTETLIQAGQELLRLRRLLQPALDLAE